MKMFSCKICRRQRKRFSGTRNEVRKHLKEEHLIKSHKIGRAKTDVTGYESNVTPQMESVEI